MKVKDIEEFVDEIYVDGKRPCEYFGMSWEMLGHLEEVVSERHGEYFNDIQGEERSYE